MQQVKQLDNVTHLRVQPHSKDAEMVLIGAMILNPKIVIPAVKSALEPADFHYRPHQVLCLACFSLEENTEIASIVQWLKGSGYADQIDEYTPVLREIAETVGTSATHEHHTRIVKELADRRALIKACREAEVSLHNESVPLDEILEQYKSAVLRSEQRRSSNYKTARELVDEIWDDLNERAGKEQQHLGVLTGFHDIDEGTGGLEPGCTYYLIANSHVGKSALALNISDNISVRYSERSVLYVTLESQAGILMRRRISRHSGIALTRIRQANIYDESEWERISTANSICGENNFILLDDTNFCDLNRLSGFIESQALRTDFSLIVIDFLQRVRLPGTWQRNDLMYDEITHRINMLAKKVKVPFLVLSQVNADGQAKQSRNIYENADNEWKLERPDKESETATLICTKGKDSGLWRTDLHFDRFRMRFSDYQSSVPGV